jgi:multidrug efflux pump subunit AcrA (membrane-fusion protein)
MDTVQTRRRSRAVHRPDQQPANDRTSSPKSKRKWPRYGYGAVAGVVIGIALAALFARRWWLPSVLQGIAAVRQTVDQPSEDHAPEDHQAEDDHAAHDHPGHDDDASLELSERGRKNVGLTLVTVEPRDFARTVSIPAALVDRPGRTELAVSAPMTGIVRRVYPIRGEAVSPGDPLFDLRLTHEDLVEKQSALLRALEELDVVKREVARLEDVTRSGAVAGKRLLEREYERQKIEAIIRADRQALMLHGLTEEQIEEIVEERRLLQSFTIRVPQVIDCEGCGQHDELLQVATLSVTPGEHVSAGTRLCTLTDHCQLYVEGKAFEHDADALNEAANKGVAVTAIVEGNGSGKHEVSDLRILYVENQVEIDSRALKFYLRLPNELVRNEQSAEGHRFIGWRYKPGQRVEVLVPVEQWEARIVLPVEAVVQDGAESYVYQQVNGHFDRKSVHVEHRDRHWAVIERDGTLFPGDMVAARGAYQIHLALKNKAGGGPDPHAGHHH